MFPYNLALLDSMVSWLRSGLNLYYVIAAVSLLLIILSITVVKLHRNRSSNNLTNNANNFENKSYMPEDEIKNVDGESLPRLISVINMTYMQDQHCEQNEGSSIVFNETTVC